MVITYTHLNNLGDKQFEKMIKALLIKVIGSGVTIFSYGKDGAREATYRGSSKYPSEVENWSGYWIFQVKFSDISLGIEKAREQVQYIINSELKKLEKYGYFKDNKCDNYFLITNVPFTGTSQTGLHDYIDKKKNDYKVKNFEYWDGEKIATLLNVNSAVRETFFTIPGFKSISENEISFIKNVYVKPEQYDALKDELIKERIVNIVGQPHVGKTILAKYMSLDICDNLKLDNILLVLSIDQIQSVTEIENCVIIFDDLFGDINYDSIGKNTKVLNTLRKKNYLITTSRDYIFEEASQNRETNKPYDSTILILQEGSYGTNKLLTILEKHIETETKEKKIKKRTINLVKKAAPYIIEQLRFPHNIELFVKSLDDSINTKAKIINKIKNAREIELVIKSWIAFESNKNKEILFVLSIIGKKVQTINQICKDLWNYSVEDIENCILVNKKILVLEGEFFRFIHPSFRTAIVNFLVTEQRSLVEPILFYFISQGNDKSLKKVNKPFIYQFLEIADVALIEKMILQNKFTSRSLSGLFWAKYIKIDLQGAFIFFQNEYLNRKDKIYYLYQSFINAKDFLHEKEVIDWIYHLFTKRNDHFLVDNLIIEFSYKLHSKCNLYFKKLDLLKFKDLQLYIKLLGVIGTKKPMKVIDELCSYAKHKNYKIRLTSLSSIFKLIRM